MKKIGLNDSIASFLKLSHPEDFDGGRIVIEHKERYIVQTLDGNYQGEITGNLRFTAESRADFPAVGDWVKIMKMDEENVIITEILPRKTLLQRQAVGKFGETQIIASNIEHAFITISTGHDFNLNRIERYLFLCNDAGIDSTILLTKTDLVNETELEELISSIKQRHPKSNFIHLSNKSGDGLDKLQKEMKPYETYCFLGSSGVGKSTIINKLAGEEVMLTSEISTANTKGRHTTSHRELIILPNKSIVIDTAGMREIGLIDSEDGIEQTFEEITELAANCRYSDCTHISESGCAVLEALEEGSLDPGLYDNYQKMKREQEHFSSSVAEKRQKDKEFGKMVREVKSIKKRLK